jgi:hypothetical protein
LTCDAKQRLINKDKSAEEYLANGESPRNEAIPLAEHAAWSQIAALPVNLSKTVTRNKKYTTRLEPAAQIRARSCLLLARRTPNAAKSGRAA